MKGEQVLKPQSKYRDVEDVYSGKGCFDGTFLLQVKPGIKAHKSPKMCSLCAIKAFQRGVRVIPIARHHNTTRYR